MKNSNRDEIREQLGALAGEALDAVRQLLRDSTTPCSVRLGAAKLILLAAKRRGDGHVPAARPAGPRLVGRQRGGGPHCDDAA